MPVFISDVEQVLALRGLETPDLAALQATHQSYRALLLQPSGPIYADPTELATLSAPLEYCTPGGSVFSRRQQFKVLQLVNKSLK